MQPSVQLSLMSADAPPPTPTVLALLPAEQRAAAVATLARLIAKTVGADGAGTGVGADDDE